MKRIARFLVLLSLFVASCGKPTKVLIQPTIPIDPSSTGSIHGVVRFDGVPPEPAKIPVSGFPDCANPAGEDADVLIRDGLVENAFVFIKDGLDQYRFPPASSAEGGEITLDQKGCVYSPRVVGLRVGQTLVIRNSDATMHNVHALPKFSSSFNVAMNRSAVDIRKTFDEPEIMVPIRCDVHPWMRAYVGVLRHPIFAVTDADGTFSLKGIPPGKYVLEAWHERLGLLKLPVTVESGKVAESSLVFSHP